jgi:hypothetical protein
MADADADADPVCSHDHMANLVATPTRSFLDAYPSVLTELKRNFMTYVKALLRPDITLTATAMQHKEKLSRLPKTDNGFPILPTPWNASPYTKKELEVMFTLYVGQHYGTSSS